MNATTDQFADGHETGRNYADTYCRPADVERWRIYWERYKSIDIEKFFGSKFPVLLWQSSPLNKTDFRKAIKSKDFLRGFLAGAVMTLEEFRHEVRSRPADNDEEATL